MADESILEVGIEDLGDTTNTLETITRLEEDRNQLKHENKALKERNKHLSECLEESENKLDKATKAFEAEYERLRESDRLRLDNRKKEEEIQRLSENLQKLQHSNDELKKKNRTHEMREMETASSPAEFGSIRGHEGCCLRVEELEEQLDSVDEQLTRYRTEAEEYKVQFENTSVLFNESRKKIKDLEQEKEELETRSQTVYPESLYSEMSLSGSIHASPTRSPVQTSPTLPTGMGALELDEHVQQISLSAELEDAEGPDVSVLSVLPPESHPLIFNRSNCNSNPGHCDAASFRPLLLASSSIANDHRCYKYE
ncbi:unnamed protein product, partial [Mesorhabditis belari]|uniref:Uncharacterized protein n=1 Tax=Mesorhabditis belari TaxID=2138241 RepID=A0AAF3J3H2_9BILA